MTYITLQLSEELDEKARIKAATMKISRSKLVRLALEKFLKENDNEMSRDNRKENQTEEGKNN